MEHAWKACKRDKRFVGSNPTSSVFSECEEDAGTREFYDLENSFSSGGADVSLQSKFCGQYKNRHGR